MRLEQRQFPAYHCRSCGSREVSIRIEDLQKTEGLRALYYCRPCFDAVANLSCASCDLRQITADDPPTQKQKG